MRSFSFIIFLFIVPGLLIGQDKKGYEISFNISGLSDSTIYLAYHSGDKQYVKDSVKVDKSGQGHFSGIESLPFGIYMIVLPGRKYFEILISNDQFFSISCSYSDYFNTLKFSGSTENSEFVDYQKKWIQMREESDKINTRLQNNKANNDSIRVLTEIQKNLESKMKSYLHQVINKNNGTLLAMLLKAILPIDVPPIILPQNTINPDSVLWIRTHLYIKDHFFDNIDFTDERILRTPILLGKLNTFFSNEVMVIQLADSINKEIDKIITKCSPNYKVFQYVSWYLFNHFRESEIMGHDAIMVKLADDIYLSGKADWTTKEWLDKLRNDVDRIRPNLIGVRGHDLIMDSFAGKYVALFDVNKEFTILYFWEPNCGHCQEATPKLKAYYDKVKNLGVEVFAVCTTADKANWEKYINDNNLTWINGWDPKRLTNFDYYYNVQSTPTVYILDKKKVIIAKKLAIEDIGPFIENWRKYNR
jgi:thiol-disulfide isomerase/thioredoxin